MYYHFKKASINNLFVLCLLKTWNSFILGYYSKKMSECIKCKQTGRFFDKNGLDFWYFVDLFRTISIYMNNYTYIKWNNYIHNFYGGKLWNIERSFKIHLDPYLFYLPKMSSSYERTPHMYVRQCDEILTIYFLWARNFWFSSSLILSRSSCYLKNWQRKYLESEESFKKNEFDSKHPFTSRN